MVIALQAQPCPTWQVFQRAMQVLPQALPVEQYLQQPTWLAYAVLGPHPRRVEGAANGGKRARNPARMTATGQIATFILPTRPKRPSILFPLGPYAVQVVAIL